MEDNKIVALIYSRNEDGLKETASKYGKILFTVAERILLNNEDSEECVNDTYTNVWYAIPPKKPQYYKAFICKITRALALDKYRYNHRQSRDSQKNISLEEIDFDIADESSTEQEAFSNLLGSQINAFLKELPEEKRTLFIRRYFMLESDREIAERFGIAESTVRVKTMRIKNELKKYLEKGGYTIG